MILSLDKGKRSDGLDADHIRGLAFCRELTGEKTGGRIRRTGRQPSLPSALLYSAPLSSPSSSNLLVILKDFELEGYSSCTRRYMPTTRVALKSKRVSCGSLMFHDERHSPGHRPFTASRPCVLREDGKLD